MTKFKPGKYRTRNGREAEVYRIDGVGTYPLIGAVKYDDGWCQCSWTLEGRHFYGGTEPNDFMPPTPKASGFVNVYEDGFTARGTHDDRADADKTAKSIKQQGVADKRIACIDLSQIDLTPFLVEDEE
jgi:hypothetical protein